MAGLEFSAPTDEVAVLAATPTTILQLRAPSNQRFKIYEISLGCKGTGPVDPPVLVRLMRQDTNGTAGASITPVHRYRGDDETIQTLIFGTFTVEPTYFEEVYGEEVHPQDRLIWQAPFGKDKLVKGGDRVGLVVLSAVSITVKGRLICEE